MSEIVQTAVRVFQNRGIVGKKSPCVGLSSGVLVQAGGKQVLPVQTEIIDVQTDEGYNLHSHLVLDLSAIPLFQAGGKRVLSKTYVRNFPDRGQSCLDRWGV